MRAWQVQRHGEPSAVLRVVNTKLPEPGPGQVRLRVKAAALGLPDVLMCRGVYPLTPTLPFTPGQEVAGVVTAVGEGVDHVVGKRVMAVTAFDTGHGGFAEEALARAGYPIAARRPLLMRSTATCNSCIGSTRGAGELQAPFVRQN
jgi:NADPH:quinone reductase